MAGELGRVARARSWMTLSVALGFVCLFVFSFGSGEPLEVFE